MKKIIMVFSVLIAAMGLSACNKEYKAYEGLWIYEDGTWHQSELIRIQPFIDDAYVFKFEVETEEYSRMYEMLEKDYGPRKLSMVPKDGYLTSDGVKAVLSEDGKTLMYKNRQFIRAKEDDIARLKAERIAENDRLGREQAERDLKEACERIRASFKGNFENYADRAFHRDDPVKLAEEIKEAESRFVEEAQAEGIPNCLNDLLQK